MVYQSEVKLLTPLALTRRRATGNDIESLDYVPGTTLRGALAAAYLAEPKRTPSDAAFRALFLGQLARFGCLRLDGADPWPLSTRTCKEWDLDHTVVDRLLATAAGLEFDSKCDHKSSDETEACGAKVEHPAGYVRLVKRRRSLGHAAREVEQRRVAHAAIDGVRLTTKSGQLYSVRSLEAGQVFQGRMVAEGEAAAALEKLSGRRLRMGRAKTRGQGLAQFEIAALGDGPGVLERQQCGERIEKLQEQARQIGGRLAGHRVVSVTLLSPALLLDDSLLSHATAKPADVRLRGEWKLLGWYNQMVSITGWHAAANLPRTQAYMAAAGSCFLYGTTGKADVSDLVDWGVGLEHAGIGDRRGEGFGEVTVCHDIHARYAEAHARG